MKTRTLSFVAALVFFTNVLLAQDSKPSVFEGASFSKAADGRPCVQLNWRKGSENTSYYLVEKSADGNNFKMVAVVFTSDDAQWRSYTYRDKQTTTSSEAVYYRIALVDTAMELTYLPVKKVVFSATEATAAVSDCENALAKNKHRNAGSVSVE